MLKILLILERQNKWIFCVIKILKSHHLLKCEALFWQFFYCTYFWQNKRKLLFRDFINDWLPSDCFFQVICFMLHVRWFIFGMLQKQTKQKQLLTLKRCIKWHLFYSFTSFTFCKNSFFFESYSSYLSDFICIEECISTNVQFYWLHLVNSFIGPVLYWSVKRWFLIKTVVRSNI